MKPAFASASRAATAGLVGESLERCDAMLIEEVAVDEMMVGTGIPLCSIGGRSLFGGYPGHSDAKKHLP